MRLHFTAISLLLMVCGASAEETYSAKALFFGENNSVIAVSTTQKDKESATVSSNQDGAKKVAHQPIRKNLNQPQYVGLSYFIRLKDPDGSTRDVLTSRKFKSGERFQLGLKVNRPSYVYVLNEGPNGKVAQIYPQHGIDNFINAMGTVFLPGKGAFEFDHEPGTEHLLVYVSSSPMSPDMTDRVRQMPPDMITASPALTTTSTNCVLPAAMQMASTPSGSEQFANAETYASKGIIIAENLSCAKEPPKVEAFASKGITFADDSDAGGLRPASYVVKKPMGTDSSLLLKIKLNHQ